MVWQQTEHEIDDVATDLDLRSLLPENGSIDPASMYVSVFGVRDGSSVRFKAFLLYDIDIGGGPDTGWKQVTSTREGIASALVSASAPSTGVIFKPYGTFSGGRVQRRMFALWKT